MHIDTKVHCPIDKGSYPTDAVFKCTDTVIDQDIIFKRSNTSCPVDEYYSPSEKHTVQYYQPNIQNAMGVA